MLRDVTVTAPAGGTMADLVSALNASAGGVGLYGGFALDADGRLAFAGGNGGADITILADTTARGAGGPSMTQLFGLDPAQAAARASGFSIRADIAADPAQAGLRRAEPRRRDAEPRRWRSATAAARWRSALPARSPPASPPPARSARAA